MGLREDAAKKLNNVKAVRELLSGTHRTQTRKQFAFKEGHTKDQWIREMKKKGEDFEEFDSEGNVTAIWTNNDGVWVRRNPNYKIWDDVRNYLNTFPNCRKEECKTKEMTRLDKRYRWITGMCADCTLEMEHELKVQGKYKEYEKKRMLNNADSFFEDADAEMDLFLKQVEEGVSYANSDGKTDDWDGAPEMAKRIRKEYEEYKNIVLDKMKE